MKKTWNEFWKNKSKKFEWTREDILASESLNQINKKILSYFKKRSLEGLKFLELGSGIGLSSFFFASRGADIALLDNSDDVKKPIAEYWQNRFNYKFIKSKN